jgi:hypothetical protein
MQPQFRPARSSLTLTRVGPGRPTIPLTGFHFLDKHDQHHNIEGRDHSLPGEDKAKAYTHLTAYT